MKSKFPFLLAGVIVTATFFIARSDYAFEAYHSVIKEKKKPSAYKVEVCSNKLGDLASDYKKKSKTLGIDPVKNEKLLDSLADAGKLEKIEEGNYYRLDKLTHSYPYLTPNTAELLETISSRFSDAVEDTDLKGAQLRVTSLLRTKDSNKKLRQKNSNASEESAHMRGIAFDISYTRYNASVKWFFRKIFMPVKSNAQTNFLKETLANVLLELKQEGKCWVTYEKKQACFHIVSKY